MTEKVQFISVKESGEKISKDYVLSKPWDMGSEVLDVNKAKKDVQCLILKELRTDELTKKKARKLLDDLKKECGNSEADLVGFVHGCDRLYHHLCEGAGLFGKAPNPQTNGFLSILQEEESPTAQSSFFNPDPETTSELEVLQTKLKKLKPITLDAEALDTPLKEGGFDSWMGQNWQDWRNNPNHPDGSCLLRAWVAAQSQKEAP